MNFNIHGNKVTVTESIKEYIEEKIGKLGRYFGSPEDLKVNIQIRVSGREQIIEVTIPTKTAILRAEEAHKDLYAAIDLVSEKLERQIRKSKTRMTKRKSKKHYEEYNLNFELDSSEEENNEIVKRKTLDLKPMSEEEAILQMDLLGHAFFVYKDVDTLSMNVLYKRKDGNYGLISTEEN